MPGYRPSFVRLPRVYRPGADTLLLAEAVAADIGGSSRPPTALELCAGTGYISMRAAGAGARVTAVDIDARAVANIRLNARLNTHRIRAVRADLRDLVPGRRYDLVFANPPYVPTDSDQLPRRGRERAWDAGRDGRALLDPLCHHVSELLAPGGRLLVVQSEVNGVEETCERLRAAGLEPSVVRTETIPFGPVMAARTDMLERRGLIAKDQRTERISVIRGLRPVPEESTANGASSDELPACQELSR